MLQDSILINQRHERFIKTVCKTECVYSLKSEDGYAVSYSNDMEDENGNEIELMCFWSEKALAQACTKEDWEEYKVSEIYLVEFIENWCIGLHNDGLLIGTNFDQNMFGYEIEALKLILELSQELKKTNKKLELKKFTNIMELETKINQIIR